jgi:type I restriction enzyme S subunit
MGTRRTLAAVTEGSQMAKPMPEALEQITEAPPRRFMPYPEYIDSGVEWLGEIPAHWKIRRLKSLAVVQLSNVDKKAVEGQESVRLCNYTDVYYNERITRDMEFMAATATSDQVQRFSLRAEDVIITKDSESWTDIAVPAVVAEDLPGVLCGYHLAHIRPNHGFNGSFMSRAFASIGPRDQFQIAANGITRFGLTRDAISTGLFAVPPSDEQRAIASFLDRETAKIDELVARKERLIELLQEKRTVLITRTVTRGLDPNVPLKDSGVEWLGEIPTHWEVVPLYARYEVALGKMLDAKRITGEYPGRYLRNVDVQWDAVNTDDLPEMDFHPSEHDRYRLRHGDLLVCEGGEIGRTAIWRGELEECFYQKAIHRVRPLSEHEVPRFLYYVMSALANGGVFAAGTNPNTIDHLTAVQLRHYRVPFAPAKEQRVIAAYLDRETAKIDALISRIREAIDLLKEFRTALISAAVTGKIDVREGVA